MPIRDTATRGNSVPFVLALWQLVIVFSKIHPFACHRRATRNQSDGLGRLGLQGDWAPQSSYLDLKIECWGLTGPSNTAGFVAPPSTSSS